MRRLQLLADNDRYHKNVLFTFPPCLCVSNYLWYQAPRYIRVTTSRRGVPKTFWILSSRERDLPYYCYYLSQMPLETLHNCCVAELAVSQSHALEWTEWNGSCVEVGHHWLSVAITFQHTTILCKTYYHFNCALIDSRFEGKMSFSSVKYWNTYHLSWRTRNPEAVSICLLIGSNIVASVNFLWIQTCYTSS